VALFDPTQDGAPLALLTLGAVGDERPLPDLQPALPEGIHLRWAFARDNSNPANNLGFPWYGFYLFRRPTLPSGTATTCAASQFTGLTPGPRSSPDLTVPLGTFHSDQNLVLTDSFPAIGTVELDLSGRTFVNFQMDPTLPNRSVDVKIGFVADFPPVVGGPGTGTGGGPLSGGLGGGAATIGVCGCGCAHDAIRPVVERVVAVGPGQYRATFGYDNEGTASISMAVGAENRFFPDPGSRGQPTLFLAGRRAEVFSIVFDGRPLTWRLGGNSVTVSAADANGSAGGTNGGGTNGGSTSADGIVVTAFNNGSAVAARIVSGRAGDVVTVTIAFEAIDAISVTSGPARLVDVCATRVTDGIGQGWTPVPNFPQPMLLPIRHNSYPLQHGSPDLTDSQSRALPRIRYGFPSAQDPTKIDTSEWTAGTAFSDLFAALVKIVQGGPPGITDFLENLAASPDPSDPDAVTPQSSQQSSLDLLLGAAVNPAMAQMLGLYWIDDQTVEGQSYDYTLVADYNNAGAGNVSTILALVTAGNYANITGYQRIGVVRAVTAPPAAPQTAAAYSLPVGGVPANTPGDVAGQVGLRWDIPTMSDTNSRIRSDAPILFHVWRKDFGLVLPTSDDVASEFQRITDLPLSAGVARTQSPSPPLAGWPTVGLFAIDGPLVEGWYAYRVSGIDIFGRYGDLSGSAPWVNAGTIQVGDPTRAVHLMDTTPPPAPTGVQAWLLDPGDPFVIQDAAYNAWRTPARANIIGLRVRWLWTGKQMQQAPDTKEFRIYLKAGSSMQNAALVTNWDRRVAAVGIGEQVLTEVLVPAVTAAAVDLAGLQATASGNVVTLADGAPLDQIDPGGGLQLQLADATGTLTFMVQAIDPVARTVTVAQTPVLAGASAWALGPAQLQGQSATAASAVVTLADAPPLARLTIDALELDLPGATGGRTRFTVLQIDSVHGTVTLDAAPVLTGTSAWTLGVVERSYEVFLPGAPLAAPLDFILPASPSDGIPVVYALVGVTAADDKTNERAVDIFAAQQAASVLVPRPGNEGAVGGPMTIVQVLRTTPAPPQLQFPQPTLSATRADFNSRSFFNLHFPRAQDLFTQVYRAVDEMVFQVDGSKRFPPTTTPPTPPSASPTSSVSAADLGWDPNTNRFSTAASAIAALTSTDGYAGLSPDALRLLASLPSNAEAFSCLTAAPLDPDTSDAVGANDDSGYQIAPTLSAYQDTLDGRASNVYFYRTAKVNRAHTPGNLGVSTPPVLLPISTPPTAPVLVDAGAGDNSIHLSWQSSLDATVSEYRIYSASTAERVAALQHGDQLTKVTETRTPDQRPLVIASGDLPVTGGQRLFFAVTAAATTPTDPVGRESGPSRIVVLKAFDDSRPTAPAWNPPQAQTGGAVLLSWTTSDPTLVGFMVQSRRAPDTAWTSVSSWLTSDVRQFLDDTRTPGGAYDYRLLVIDNRGRQNNVFNTVSA
jgi:hypothetical protein